MYEMKVCYKYYTRNDLNWSEKMCHDRHKNNLNSTDEKYEHIYQRCIKMCPGMKPLIERIRQIPPPKHKERDVLLLKIKSGDKTAKNRLVEMYLRNALRIALEAAEASFLSLEDIFSETVIGLMERLNCTPTYDNYSAFISAGMRIKAYNYVRKNNVKFISYEDYCEKIKEKYYDGEKFVLRRLYLKQLNETLSDVLLKKLTDREKKVLNLRFGLGDDDKLSYQKIAEIFKSDRKKIRYIEQKSLHKLRPSYYFPNNLKEFL